MTLHTKLSEMGLFDARVPRYTSYPTALQFTEDIGPGDTSRWIAEIKPGSRISVYVHVPFCRRLCWFCACRTQGTATASPVDSYLQSVKMELQLISELLPDDVAVEHLHWGGGTPTLMSPAAISDLAAAMQSAIPMAKDAQFSVEIDPSEIDQARMNALTSAGMNRASIGVQDFDPKIQETIGRLQSFEVTKFAVNGLRERGIKSLNMDILFGLPYQTNDGITDSVKKVLTLSPDRIALYGYAHVPWVAKRQKMIPEDALPTPRQRLALFETARHLFVQAGYQEIGIDHFARPTDGLAIAQQNGRLRRNFQGYTEDTSRTLIGIGASAISRYPGGYAQNDPSTSGYQRAVRGGALATGRGHEFAAQDHIRGRMIETLLCDFAIDFGQLSEEFPTSDVNWYDLAENIASNYPDMVELSANRLQILAHGKPLARIIASELDSYAVSSASHSQAI